MKYSGKIIRAVPPSTTTGYGANGTAGGMWTATEALQKKAAGVWPNAPDVPGVPTITGVTAGDTQVTVAFTAPSDNGGLNITSYTVTSNPGSITASGASSPIIVAGLTNGVSYTFTVKATNSKGDSVSSAASSSVTPFLPLTSIELLVVGGGGGGGARHGGGGGAGGLLYGNYSITQGTPYTVTIGGGGVGQYSAPNGLPGTNGSNTVFGTATALGGGGGGSYSGGALSGGGSGGGGGGGNNQSPASASQGNSGGLTGYGNSGGTGSSGTAGGGGGGAGASGSNAVDGNVGGPGGDGRQYSISGTSQYYAGGGGGGSEPTRSNVSGGLGGGGVGDGQNSNGGNGTSNTGGGGGGTRSATTSLVGGTGGSGVVILRYPDTYSAASVTGNPSVTVSGGYRIYQFNGSGSITF